MFELLFFIYLSCIQSQELTKCGMLNGKCSIIYDEYIPTLHKPKFTNFYNANWKSDNSRHLFYDERSFGIKLPKSTHMDIRKTRTSFLNYLKRFNIKCTGKYCIDGEYKCTKPDCYHVEHIIDMNGPEFGRGNKCKDIIANKVMTYSRWNQALGGSRYENSIYEKEIVYGAAYGRGIINEVRKKIRECIANSDRESTIHSASPIKKRDDNQYIDVDTCQIDEDCGCDPDSDCECDCTNDGYFSDFSYDEVEELIVSRDYYHNNFIMTFVFFALTMVLFIGNSLFIITKYTNRSKEQESSASILPTLDNDTENLDD
jgi:hypothetical protein